MRRANAWPVATSLGALLAALLASSPWFAPNLQGLMEWQRSSMGSEFWRILTSHFAHFSFEHFAYDWIVYVALGWACERRWPNRTRWTLLVSAFLIPVVVYRFAPELHSYRGLSGLDSALVLLLAFGLASEPGFESRFWRWLPWLVSIGFLVKILFEFQTATTVFVSDSALFVPVPIAHGIGAIVGALAAPKRLRGGRARGALGLVD